MIHVWDFERIWGALRKNALYKSTYTLLYFTYLHAQLFLSVIIDNLLLIMEKCEVDNNVQRNTSRDWQRQRIN